MFVGDGLRLRAVVSSIVVPTMLTNLNTLNIKFQPPGPYSSFTQKTQKMHMTLPMQTPTGYEIPFTHGNTTGASTSYLNSRPIRGPEMILELGNLFCSTLLGTASLSFAISTASARHVSFLRVLPVLSFMRYPAPRKFLEPVLHEGQLAEVGN